MERIGLDWIGVRWDGMVRGFVGRGGAGPEEQNGVGTLFVLAEVW